MAFRASAKRAFRIATLVVPSWLAWYVAFSQRHPNDLMRVVTFALGPLWVLLAGALVVRLIVAGTAIILRRGQPQSPQQQQRVDGAQPPPSRITELLAQIDVLTSSGSALAWFSAFAIMGAVWIGWASLAAVGLLGTGLFHIVVLYTFLALRGQDPMRVTTISRRFLPEVVTEGDSVTEELRFAGVRIPIGFRLFATGRVGPRWATSRHVLDAAESGDGAEVVLGSDVGPAVRGDHAAEPVEVWLEDTFGLCRSMRMPIGTDDRLTVLPRTRLVDKTASLLDHGLGPRTPRPTSRLPTEGNFRLREYQQGDDVRRIHWVHSLRARELVVRLPDEVPPDRPRVRLVLDTFFPEAFALSCDAPAEMLDAIVAVWLAVGKSLAESGARVTLVTAVARQQALATARQELMLRSPGSALRLGAQVAWQNQMMVEELLTDDEATFVVSRGVLTPEPPTNGKVRWIMVGSSMITTEPLWPFPSGVRLPYPMGSSENRWSHRRKLGNRLAQERFDHARAIVALRTNLGKPPAGSLVALPGPEGAIRLEAMRCSG